MLWIHNGYIGKIIVYRYMYIVKISGKLKLLFEIFFARTATSVHTFKQRILLNNNI